MNARILCIEDDEETLDLLVETLHEQGYQVETARNGKDGLDAILSSPPDLVLCDISMPKLSGFDLLEKLSKTDSARLGSVPFVFLTALADRDSTLRGRRLGADDYVTKPIDFEILLEVIRARLSPTGRLGRKPTSLSPREIEVLTWVARGKSSTDIAALLKVSDRTIDFHVENILRKFGVATRVQAALRGRHEGLIKD